MDIKTGLGIAGGVVATAGLSSACYIKGKANGRKQGILHAAPTGFENGRQSGMRTAYQICKENIEPLGPKITNKGEIIDEPNNRSVFRIDVALANAKIITQLKEAGFVFPKD